MRQYEYDFTIWRDNSPKKFKEACAQIERAYPNCTKKELLVDVDGSTIQVYYLGKKKVVVYDDYDVGAVYVLSDADLSNAITIVKSA